jgi:hypothetical protein
VPQPNDHVVLIRERRKRYLSVLSNLQRRLQEARDEVAYLREASATLDLMGIPHRDERSTLAAAQLQEQSIQRHITRITYLQGLIDQHTVKICKNCEGKGEFFPGQCTRCLGSGVEPAPEPAP